MSQRSAAAAKGRPKQESGILRRDRALASTAWRIGTSDIVAHVIRAGIVNAWADPRSAGAVEGTGRKSLITASTTTDVCPIYPAIDAR